jgi:protein-tyrosine phosphatase
MIRVLFVCHGNICRSPMAEAVFVDLVTKAGLRDKFKIDSAGTSDEESGSLAHPGTLRVLKQNGIEDYAGRSRQITRTDLSSWDYILVMDDYNMANLKWFGTPAGKVSRLLDYAPHLPEREVPDPYYKGGYEKVYALVKAGCEGLLAEIRREHGL